MIPDWGGMIVGLDMADFIGTTFHDFVWAMIGWAMIVYLVIHLPYWWTLRRQLVRDHATMEPIRSHRVTRVARETHSRTPLS